jgi:hypothetical protein
MSAATQKYFRRRKTNTNPASNVDIIASRLNLAMDECRGELCKIISDRVKIDAFISKKVEELIRNEDAAVVEKACAAVLCLNEGMSATPSDVMSCLGYEAAMVCATSRGQEYRECQNNIDKLTQQHFYDQFLHSTVDRLWELCVEMIARGKWPASECKHLPKMSKRSGMRLLGLPERSNNKMKKMKCPHQFDCIKHGDLMRRMKGLVNFLLTLPWETVETDHKGYRPPNINPSYTNVGLFIMEQTPKYAEERLSSLMGNAEDQNIKCTFRDLLNALPSSSLDNDGNLFLSDDDWLRFYNSFLVSSILFSRLTR